MKKDLFNLKMKVRPALAAVGCAVLLFALACTDTAGKKDAAPNLATVGSIDIPAEALRQNLAERPLGRKNDSVSAAVKKRLEEMILEEVLYQEAIAQKIDQDPLVRKAVRQLLVTKLLESHVEKPAWDEPVNPDRVRSYYEAHRHEFERPEQVRLADILIAVPKDAQAHERAELLQRAEGILAEAIALKNERGAFNRLIAHYSDTPAHYHKGDTGFFDPQGGPAGIDSNLVRAAFQIEKNGSIPGRVIEASDGFHVIMRIAKRSAVQTPLGRVEKDLIQRIKREDLAAARESYFAALKEKLGIRIDDQALSGFVLDVEKVRQALSSREKNRHARSAKGSAPPMPVSD